MISVYVTSLLSFQISIHRFCFRKIYLEPYFWEHLIVDIDILLEIILIPLINIYVVSIDHSPSSAHRPVEEKWYRCLLLVDSFEMAGGIQKCSAPISLDLYVSISRAYS